jgi:hypothetical protein
VDLSHSAQIHRDSSLPSVVQNDMLLLTLSTPENQGVGTMAGSARIVPEAQPSGRVVKTIRQKEIGRTIANGRDCLR